MEINGYLIYNVTENNTHVFKSQIEGFIAAFKELSINLKTIDNLHALSVIKKEKKVDFVLFWDKDIALVYELMNLKIKIFNNVEALRLADDKAFTFARLESAKIYTPKTIVLPLTFFDNGSKYFDEIKKIMNEKEITYPCLVKERRNSLGLGVYFINNETELLKILKDKWNKELLIQEYIKEEYGKDYRVYLINHRPIAVVSRTNKNDFRSNVELGGVMEVINKPPYSLIKTAMRASLALKLDFGAVDLVKERNKYYVLEVNSNAKTVTIDKIAKIELTKKVAQYIIDNI